MPVSDRATNTVPEQGDKSQPNSGHPNQPKYADSLAFAWKRPALVYKRIIRLC